MVDGERLTTAGIGFRGLDGSTQPAFFRLQRGRLAVPILVELLCARPEPVGFKSAQRHAAMIQEISAAREPPPRRREYWGQPDRSTPLQGVSFPRQHRQLRPTIHLPSCAIPATLPALVARSGARQPTRRTAVTQPKGGWNRWSGCLAAAGVHPQVNA